jgi:tRNA(His) 5'-end guanylyltransferase
LEIQGVQVCYTQSDEISVLFNDYTKLDTCAWYDYNIQKMVSVAASTASLAFSHSFGQDGVFDARVFNLPIEEVTNYFIWRQQDCYRNSILTAGQSQFSAKKMHGKSCKDVLDMLETEEKIHVWDGLRASFKYGIFVYKLGEDCAQEVGDIKLNREFIENFCELSE